MGDAGGELSEAGEFFLSDELGLGGAQRFQGLAEGLIGLLNGFSLLFQLIDRFFQQVGRSTLDFFSAVEFELEDGQLFVDGADRFDQGAFLLFGQLAGLLDLF